MNCKNILTSLFITYNWLFKTSETQYLFQSRDILFVSRRVLHLFEMRLGQIGCGRQNPPIKSAELASSRIGMAKGMPSTSLQDWKAATAPLFPQKCRWYDAGGFPYRSACTKQPRYAPGCLYPSRWLPWLRRCAQRTQANLKLMIIRVNLQFVYRRPNQYKRKLCEWIFNLQLLTLQLRNSYCKKIKVNLLI
ncbi:Hypothetical_protein [Hexamita inflata]|uniref:Hypothetical_protein n=1 Tax=Hexamita inflata TaxID=28002 RepID=A0AA86UC84_9EUKA|nr:Hypothetical protein HINF_LOCUS37555 [Hexamita inflata]CAI9949914.1 Hypothetical protein HINF_LOCUS37559 [Hexamita inflata]